ncbi:MAG: hypothetical protein K1X28_03015 [Parachlamydiales bacterium]|nr:hypothetical protein [Parachlamydiales bacterium]
MASPTLAPSTPPFHPRFHEASPLKHKLIRSPDTTEKKIRKAVGANICQLRRAGDGNTGITLIGSASAEIIIGDSEIPHDMPIGFVLKWAEGADNEMICTRIAKHFGLETPEMVLIHPTKVAEVAKATKKLAPRFSKKNSHDLILMNQIKGANFSSFCKSDEILSLSKESWNKMMHYFGKISVFDIFIGNYDRFVRFKLDDEGVFVLEESPEANAGNIMLQATPEKRRTLSRVAVIDTSSLAPQASEEKMAMEEITKLPKRSLAPGLHEFFKTMMARGPMALSAHVSTSITNAMRRATHADPERQSVIFERMQQALPKLSVGIVEGFAQIQDPAFLAKAQDAAEGSRPLSELIRLNSQYLRESESAREFPQL